MKWLLMGVAFVLGAAVTWLVTVKRVTRVVSVDSTEAGHANQGGSGMGSTGAQGVGESAQDQANEAGTVVDQTDDPSRFGGERTSATVSPRVGWDDDAEDIDALLSDEEKSSAPSAEGAERRAAEPPVTGEQASGGQQSD